MNPHACAIEDVQNWVSCGVELASRYPVTEAESQCVCPPPPRGRWRLPAALLAAVWVTVIIWPLAPLMVVPMGGILVLAAVRRSFVIAALLLVSPSGISLIAGVADWFSERPSFHFMGLPSPRADNLDPASRCFHATGGCLVSGGEWLIQGPHNLGLGLMVRLLGPPRTTYDGPYPTQAEADELTKDAAPTAVAEFVDGSVRLGTNTLTLSRDYAQTLAMDAGAFCFDCELDNSQASVRAAMYGARCLLIRLAVRHADDGLSAGDVDCIFLIDATNQRAFARYPLEGRPNRISSALHDRWER